MQLSLVYFNWNIYRTILHETMYAFIMPEAKVVQCGFYSKHLYCLWRLENENSFIRFKIKILETSWLGTYLQLIWVSREALKVYFIMRKINLVTEYNETKLNAL